MAQFSQILGYQKSAQLLFFVIVLSHAPALTVVYANDCRHFFGRRSFTSPDSRAARLKATETFLGRLSREEYFGEYARLRLVECSIESISPGDELFIEFDNGRRRGATVMGITPTSLQLQFEAGRQEGVAKKRFVRIFKEKSAF